MFVLVVSGFLFAGACSKKEAKIEPTVAPPNAEAALPVPSRFNDIDQSLKTGAFDDAAARLLEMRTVRNDFTPKEAADYRRKLNDAYSAALEAADKGDPRAKAAIEMIRANPGR
jgi:hypothetical protein